MRGGVSGSVSGGVRGGVSGGVNGGVHARVGAGSVRGLSARLHGEEGLAGSRLANADDDRARVVGERLLELLLTAALWHIEIHLAPFEAARNRVVFARSRGRAEALRTLGATPRLVRRQQAQPVVPAARPLPLLLLAAALGVVLAVGLARRVVVVLVHGLASAAPAAGCCACHAVLSSQVDNERRLLPLPLDREAVGDSKQDVSVLCHATEDSFGPMAESSEFPDAEAAASSPQDLLQIQDFVGLTLADGCLVVKRFIF